MRVKQQTVYDLNSEQFKYLKREKNSHLHKVDINELNKRLNKTKRTSFYNTLLICVACFLSLVILSLVSIKF